MRTAARRPSPPSQTIELYPGPAARETELTSLPAASRMRIWTLFALSGEKGMAVPE